MATKAYVLETVWTAILADLGVVPADVLRRAELPTDLFDQPTFRLAATDYHRFWAALEEEVGDPLFALRFSQVATTVSATPLVFAALCSPNFWAAVERTARYKALVAPMRATVAAEGDLVAVDLSWPDVPPPPASLVLKELLVGLAMARAGTRHHVCPVEVTTTDLPADPAPYEEVLGAPLRRGPRHRLVLTRADATRPFLTSDEGLWSAFEPALRQRLEDMAAPATTARRVRAVLVEALPSGLVTLDEVGRRLATSTRTLQRRLAAEGTSFQAILAETRETLARHYLELGALPTPEIALLLGYDEPSSFARAFKTWTGTTPDVLRRQHREAGDGGGRR